MSDLPTSVRVNLPSGQSKPSSIDWRAMPGKIWRFLTEPSDAIREPEMRRRARLLSALLLPLAVLGALSFLITPSLYVENYRPLEDPTFYTSLGGAVAVAIAYGLSRTRYYIPAVVTTVSIVSLMAIASAIALPVQTERMLAYLVTVVLLGSMLLSARDTLILAVTVFTGGVVLVSILASDAPPGAVMSAVVYQMIMGTLIMIFAAIRQRDLLQIEQQSRELAEAVQQAQIANKLKSQFLATMSHELRTPLNAIIGFTEVMMMGLAGELPSQASHATNRIHHNSERLLQLIDDILDISKIEAGRVEILRRPFEPVELLEDVKRVMEPQAVDRGLKFTTFLDPNLPRRIVGDVKRLEQVMLNLTSNAVKFTEQGSVNVAFKRFNEREWAIEVADTGIGIPPHARDIVFEKFRQVDGTSRRAYRGSGLGLAIVKELVLLMDGNVTLKSAVGVGSTFTVTLPLLESEEGMI